MDCIWLSLSTRILDRVTMDLLQGKVTLFHGNLSHVDGELCSEHIDKCDAEPLLRQIHFSLLLTWLYRNVMLLYCPLAFYLVILAGCTAYGPRSDLQLKEPQFGKICYVRAYHYN